MFYLQSRAEIYPDRLPIRTSLSLFCHSNLMFIKKFVFYSTELNLLETNFYLYGLEITIFIWSLILARSCIILVVVKLFIYCDIAACIEISSIDVNFRFLYFLYDFVPNILLLFILLFYHFVIIYFTFLSFIPNYESQICRELTFSTSGYLYMFAMLIYCTCKIYVVQQIYLQLKNFNFSYWCFVIKSKQYRI